MNCHIPTAYRPKTFKEVVGQTVAVSALKKIAMDSSIPVRAIFLKGAYGSGKCVPAGTRVLTSKGYVPIETLYLNPEEGFNDFTTEVHTRFGARTSDKFYYQKQVEVLNLKLSNGYVLRGTPKHRVMVHKDGKSELIRLGDLALGDSIMLSNDVQEFGVDDARAWLLGALLGDGGRSKGQYYFCGTKEMCLKVASEAGWSGALVKDKRREDLYTVRPWISDGTLVELPYDCNSENKELPEWAFNLSIESRWALLQGILDTDGSLSKEFDITLKSQKLVEQLYEIFQTLGCIGSLSLKKVKGETYYRLRVSNTELNNSPLQKYDKLLRLEDSMNVRKFVDISDTEIQELTILRRQLEHHKGDYAYKTIQNFKVHKRATRRTLLNLKDIFGRLPMSLDEAVKYSHVQIKSVHVSFEDVYDLSVPDVHEFYAQGTYNHNTTLSKLFGKAMNCKRFSELGDVCNECESCLEFSTRNTQLYYEFDSSMVGNVESIRNLSDLLAIAPQGKRVVVFDEIHAASSAALNALLKIVEEGVRDTVFVFCSTEDILATLKSRSLVLEVSTVPSALLINRVSEIALDCGISISKENLDILALKANGHMRDALSILQLYSLIGEDALTSSYHLFQEFVVSLIKKDVRAIGLIDSLMKYPIVDVRHSIYQFIRSLYLAEPGSLEHSLVKTNIHTAMFNFFFSPVAQQAMRDESGIDILLRSFASKLIK